MRSLDEYPILSRSIMSTLLLSLFLLPSISYAIRDGNWEGVTDQGLDISFSTSGETANDIVTRIRIFCSGFSVVSATNWSSQPIVNDSFSVSSYTSACTPFEPWNLQPFGFTANFTGETTCQGTYFYRTTQSGTWEATNTSINAPTVTTLSVSSVTSNSANSGGNITSDGGASVTARGVCWSTSADPTTDDNKTTDGDGAGSFTSYITGLSPTTPYHVRAYATNSAGTAYGNDVSFTTTYSAVLYVSAAGCGDKQPCYASIQEAMNMAGDGAIIKVANGKYPEPPEWKVVGTVTISGGWKTDFSGQTGTTEMYAPRSTGGGTVKVLPNVRVAPQP